MLPGINNENPNTEIMCRQADTFDCFMLYPQDLFEKMENQIVSQLNTLINEDVEAMTSFYESVEKVVLDKQKRFKIPIEIRSMFKNEVVIIGIGQFMQMWDKETYENRKEEIRKNGGALSKRLSVIRDMQNKNNNFN